MPAAQSADLEREEFLSVPPLFRYGPRVLLFAGLLLAVLALATGLWRVHEGRQADYVRAFADARAAAAAAKENLGQLLARLDRAGLYLDSIQGASGQPQQVTAVLQGLAPSGVALSSGGLVLAASGASPGVVAAALGAAQDARSARLPPGGRTMLPALGLQPGGSTVVPVVQRPSQPGPVDRVVIFLDEEALSGSALKAFGPAGGWLHIDDAAGHAVLDRQVDGSRPGPAARRPLRSVDEAMNTADDGSARRLLVASAPAAAGEATVTVGLDEAASMAGVSKRIASTWVLVAFVIPVLACLALTSVALTRFSRVEAYLRRLARVDVLTGLPNRRSFQGLLRAAVARAQRREQTLALLFVDIDNFKYVNDSLGHTVGDALLKHVGALLREAARPGDAVCRLGGDEFTVIAGEIDGEAAALALGNRILERLQQAVRLDGVELRTKASIGIALMPTIARSEEDLMRFADTAMYQAKNEGKHHCVVYDHSMAARALHQAQTIQQLERDIAADRLFLLYQPKFDLASGRLAGHEALVRWRHAERGIVPAGEFIPLAEESGLITELGQWVLDRALRQIGEWQRQGLGWHRVAVNVSALQLRDDGFVAHVAEALRRHAIEGPLLQLEITESSLAADVDKVRGMVHALQALGVRVAVDDFGTGYSSLAALQQFELDTLKLDRSFVSAIHTPRGEAVCRAVITMAHALGLAVIGEGVETAEQAKALARLGCDQVQGFHFARPMSPEIAGRTTQHAGACLRGSAAALADSPSSAAEATC